MNKTRAALLADNKRQAALRQHERKGVQLDLGRTTALTTQCHRRRQRASGVGARDSRRASLDRDLEARRRRKRVRGDSWADRVDKLVLCFMILSSNLNPFFIKKLDWNVMK